MSSMMLLAYVDPVSGVILLQLFIGGCIGLMAGFHRRIWRFITRPFAKAKAEETIEIPTTPSVVRAVGSAAPAMPQTTRAELAATEEQREIRKAA